MINKHITDYLDYYLNEDVVSPNFAVMIRGDWGCGKTWFVKKYIEENQDKKFIYVSLYGVKGIKDIEDSFFEELHPLLASKGMKIASKVLKGLIKASIKIDFDDDGNSDGTITSTTPDINFPQNFRGLDKAIIVFDDLERCSMEPELFLGYINQFVEHNDQKIIIIANEDELISGDKNERYVAIKEKVIGKSFDYLSDIDSALDIFLKLTSRQGKTVLIDYKNLIKLLYKQCGYNNLRHLKQSILDFERFISFLPDKCFKKTDLIEHLVSFFFIISFEMKKGVIREDSINSVLFSSFEKSLNEEKDEIRDKYSILDSVYPPLNDKLWKCYFKKGYIEQEELIEWLNISPYFEEENTPLWVKMWRYWDLDDDEFKSYVDIIIKDIENFNINDVFVLTHLVGIFLNLSKFELIDLSKKDILQKAKKLVDNLYEKEILADTEINDSNLHDSYGYKYLGIENEEFLLFCEYLKIKASESKIRKYPRIAQDLLKLMTVKPREFESQTNPGNYSGYGNVPILIHIKSNDFVDALFSLSNKDKRIIGSALKQRYQPVANYNLLQEEEWLLSVQNEIRSKLKEHDGLISSRILIGQCDELIEEAIIKLRETKNLNRKHVG